MDADHAEQYDAKHASKPNPDHRALKIKMNALKICHWNANGLSQHILELSSYLHRNNIDVILISETHLTQKNCIRIDGYKFYDTKHPDGKAHGGTGIFIKKTISHYEKEELCEQFLQATSICIQADSLNIVISAIYCPPRFNISSTQFANYFNSLGPKFLAAGDYNAKHSFWGSRLISPRGRQLYNAIINQYDVISTGEPTHWPSDNRKIPVLIDFGIFKGLQRQNIIAESSLELSSDHSPVVLTILNLNPNILTNDRIKSRTNWSCFANKVEQSIPSIDLLPTEVSID